MSVQVSSAAVQLPVTVLPTYLPTG